MRKIVKKDWAGLVPVARRVPSSAAANQAESSNFARSKAASRELHLTTTRKAETSFAWDFQTIVVNNKRNARLETYWVRRIFCSPRRGSCSINFVGDAPLSDWPRTRDSTCDLLEKPWLPGSPGNPGEIGTAIRIASLITRTSASHLRDNKHDGFGFSQLFVH